MGVPLLFNKCNVFDLIEVQKENLKQLISGMSLDEVQKPTEEFVPSLVSKFARSLPVIEENKIEVSRQEIQVDVSRDPTVMAFDGPVYRPGTRITVHIPFSGVSDWFLVRPSTYTLSPPRGEVDDRELRLIFITTDSSAEHVKTEIAKALKEIKQYLEWLAPAVKQLQSELTNVATTEIANRRRYLESQSNMISSLGFPERKS